MNLYHTMFGYIASQILYAAVRLGVPDALADGPAPPEALARSVGCDPDGLTRLVRALVVLGVVEIVAPGSIALAEAGRPLCAAHPRSMRSSVLLLGEPAMWRAWEGLTHGVRTGEAAFDHVHGLPLFGYMAGQPAMSGVFGTAMREGTAWIAAGVPRAYDFTAARTVVDIGGGSGALLAAVLAAAPGARGILFDTADGAACAAGTLRRAGLSGRYAIETGDFFRAVPAGDVLLLKDILHDWDDRRCRTVLGNCRESIASDGRLLVLEAVRPDRLDAPEAVGVVMSDITMLVYTGGRERSRSEFRALLDSSGFCLAGVTPPLPGAATRILIAAPV